MRLRVSDACTARVRGYTCGRCGHAPCTLLTTEPDATAAERVPFPASCINGSKAFVADLRLGLKDGSEIYVYVLAQGREFTVEERILLRNASSAAELLIVLDLDAEPGAGPGEGKVLQLAVPAQGVPQTRRYPEKCVHCADADRIVKEEQQRLARQEDEAHQQRMVRQADLATAALLRLRAENAVKLAQAASEAANQRAKPLPAFKLRQAAANQPARPKAVFKLKQATAAASQPAKRPWEEDYRTWAVRDKAAGTVVVYKHEDGLMCPIPGMCRHQAGACTFHG